MNDAHKRHVQEEFMNQAVVCIAPDVSEAEREVTTLREAGFASADISVLWPDTAGAQELGYEHHTKAPEGIAWGVLFGAIVGGALAYLNVTLGCSGRTMVSSARSIPAL
jgi:hypothetical protein